MESIHILFRRNGFHDAALTDRRRERKLYQNPVDRGVGIELADDAKQLLLRNGARQIKAARVKAAGCAILFLIVHVKFRDRVIPHHDRGKPRFSRQTRRLFPDLLAYRRRKRFPVKNYCHGSISSFLSPDDL